MLHLTSADAQRHSFSNHPAPPRRHRRSWLIAALAGATSLSGGAVHAAGATAAQLQQLESQMEQLEMQNAAEIASLKAQMAQLQAEQAQQSAVVIANSTAVAKTAASQVFAHMPKVIESKTHQFGLESADGANKIALVARLQLDGADYLTTKPEGGKIHGTGPGSNSGEPLESGVNARRARIGVTGTFQNDWDYRFVYDFGGSADSVTTGVSGADTSGIENAYITYQGFNHPNDAIRTSIDLGYMDVPWTLDEATSSADIMFMERSSSQVIATEFGASDYRSAFGAHTVEPLYWVGAYLTGPTSGSPHTGADDPSGAALLRGTVQLLTLPDASLHVGGDFDHTFQVRAPYIAQSISCSSTTPYTCTSPPAAVKTNSSYLTLSDRPELRIDPTSILTTGYIPTRSGDVIEGEVAGTLGPFFMQGEYFHYIIDQLRGGVNPSDGTVDKLYPTLTFNGGYIEASYAIGGARKYIPGTGAYSTVVPTTPFDISGGGWGAVEFAARYDDVDLNDDIKAGEAPHLTGGVEGGTQQAYTLGVNWYPNIDMKFVFDFQHTQVDRLKVTTNGTIPTLPAGTTINAIAARAQFSY